MVLYPDGTENLKTAFKYFIERETNYKVKWVTRWTHSGKYLLLCYVESRIPEDVMCALQRLGLHGN